MKLHNEYELIVRGENKMERHGYSINILASRGKGAVLGRCGARKIRGWKITAEASEA